MRAAGGYSRKLLIRSLKLQPNLEKSDPPEKQENNDDRKNET
jgi:hypothetical protein